MMTDTERLSWLATQPEVSFKGLPDSIGIKIVGHDGITRGAWRKQGEVGPLIDSIAAATPP